MATYGAAVVELPLRYRRLREPEIHSFLEITAATFNVAKGTQRRMGAIIGDIMKSTKLYGEAVATGDA